MTKSKDHIYNVNLVWTGNPLTAAGQGTYSYTSYERSFEIHAEGKAVLQGSSDVAYRGDATKYNPEEMLVAALSSCHMLWYLHLCADNGITVLDYKDNALGYMEPESVLKNTNGSVQLRPGKFTRIILQPEVRLSNPDDQPLATLLHQQAHKRCFIANSVNFDVLTEPVFTLQNTEK
ncbi:Organic hydroperoxide reductase OsmC/OhrA [Arachidicoccus rhizosphaerae]|uniref:Organic hydroperoxide reductase OsmC/OhrA n=1 Tax=Arachidicoccus rhizosphaerae TaxID=551991 RepID=A0A1H4AZ37_9BACT|nr:OsmC family protein [Arachidicoccus rhizosphaerae]SEA41183.1 Organic hydroperoxide reductase OsmC/OhrA [Arachidicoccus rhizosphaerae]